MSPVSFGQDAFTEEKYLLSYELTRQFLTELCKLTIYYSKLETDGPSRWFRSHLDCFTRCK